MPVGIGGSKLWLFRFRGAHITGASVKAVLARRADLRLMRAIPADHGPAFERLALDTWAYERALLVYPTPQPNENTYIQNAVASAATSV
jgi:hypothetical protein